MLKHVPLGQYFAGNSIIHRLDPRIKIILSILYITATFLCKSIISFAILAFSGLVLVFLSKIPAKMILLGMRPILFIMIFTAAINIFWTTGDTVLVEWKFIHIYLEGVINAALMVVRIMSLITGTSIFLTYTTSPIVLTDAIEQLLDPLKKIKLPVHEFAMMMTIALRFIPTLMEETDKIMSAQKSRGADFSTGNLIERGKSLIPVLVPLFISAFRRADELATAMECRCYRGGEGRTRMNVLKYSANDFVACSILVLFCVVIVVVNKFGVIFGI